MTAYESLISDWISDVCSSGLREHRQREQPRRHGRVEHRQLGIETEQRRNSGKREPERHEREREAGARLRHPRKARDRLDLAAFLVAQADDDHEDAERPDRKRTRLKSSN